MTSSMMFINLSVADIARSRAFFSCLGFRFDEFFSDGATLCMPVNDQTVVIMQRRSRFAGHAGRVADLESGRETVLALAAPSRRQVDQWADAALASGGRALRAVVDLEFCYCRSFCDPDGHAWEAVWLDGARLPTPS